MSVDDQVEHIRRALEAHRRALEDLETTFLGLEETLEGKGVAEPTNGHREDSSELLSVLEVCQDLGMGKSWVHRRIRSGEIPSVRLGRKIKVKREDLQEYLESHRYQPTKE